MTDVSKALEQVRVLVVRGEVRVSLHGYEELATDTIRMHDVVDGLEATVAVEDYPNYPKGPCVLVLEQNGEGRPIHVVWGIPLGRDSPAVLITAYRPDPEKWDVEKEADMSRGPIKRLVREG